MKIRGHVFRKTTPVYTPQVSAEVSNNSVKDLPEVEFLRPAVTTLKKQTTKRPLIDIVNPQPKAFYSHLPKSTSSKAAVQRISRKKVGN